MAYLARLESVCTAKRYRGFESPSLRKGSATDYKVLLHALRVQAFLGLPLGQEKNILKKGFSSLQKKEGKETDSSKSKG